uniref:ZP domain-containing protein n=1 Tax=Megaselia scalaris TaxID=36166 RepID=T1GVX6_MEGSC
MTNVQVLGDDVLRSIQLAVRVHKNLELAEDKFFIITCGKNGIYKQLFSATHPIIVKNCVAFDKNDSTIPLINEYGCPYNPDIITPFIHDYETKTSKSTLKSMFKFPEKSEVHLQCDIGQCENNCFDVSMCNNVNFAGFTAGNSNDQNSSVNDIKKQLTTTTVFVLDPSESKGCSNNSGVKPSWILWLTVAFGVLFVIMLLMNIFLCTAMNCSWARTDVLF